MSPVRHEADIKPRPLFGRYGVESGHHLLGLSLSAFDPKRTLIGLVLNRRRLPDGAKA
jgi:hypothetical protein